MAETRAARGGAQLVRNERDCFMSEREREREREMTDKSKKPREKTDIPAVLAYH